MVNKDDNQPSSEILQRLPRQPSYQHSCDLLDTQPDTYWLPVLSHIASRHSLPDGQWQRIREGGNLLFKLDQDLIIKIVPPTWGYQGEAEIEASRLLSGRLTLTIPEVKASGRINDWIYVVMSVVTGCPLSAIWPDLPHRQKLELVQQLGTFIRHLHQLPMPSDSPLRKDWRSYHQSLLDDCIARHRRKGLDSKLIEQLPALLASTESYFDDGETFFIHMDLHPWNLMVQHLNGRYRLSGVLDFGDAVIGRSRLLELNTPILFLCQGNAELIEALLDSYQLLNRQQQNLPLRCLVNSLIRPACDYNFVLSQVPQTGPRDNWQQVAAQLFPLC